MASREEQALAERSINVIRGLAIDAVEKAQSGHPGMPMGAAPMAYALWQNFLRHDPSDPKWPDRDRFVLSAGHGSMLLYALLHLTGYDLPLDELKSFRQWGSRTPGHPEYGLTAGLFSEDENEIYEWLDRIQAGVVYVNRRAGSTTGAASWRWPISRSSTLVKRASVGPRRPNMRTVRTDAAWIALPA